MTLNDNLDAFRRQPTGAIASFKKSLLAMETNFVTRTSHTLTLVQTRSDNYYYITPEFCAEGERCKNCWQLSGAVARVSYADDKWPG
jgi:hypothetical protein